MSGRRKIVSTTIYTVYGKEISAKEWRINDGWLHARTEWEDLYLPPNNVKYMSVKYGIVEDDEKEL